MRYTERDYDITLDGPLDGIRLLSSFIFLAPYRLFNEISTKIIFVGLDNILRMVKTSIIVNGILLGGNVAYNFLYIHRYNVLVGPIPLIVFIVSFILNCLTYFLIPYITSNALTSDISIEGLDEVDYKRSKRNLTINNINNKPISRKKESSIIEESVDEVEVENTVSLSDLDDVHTFSDLDESSIETLDFDESNIMNDLDDIMSMDFDMSPENIVHSAMVENIGKIESIEKSRIREDRYEEVGKKIFERSDIDDVIDDNFEEIMLRRSSLNDSTGSSKSPLDSWLDGL